MTLFPKINKGEVVSQSDKAHGKGSIYLLFYSSMISHAVKFNSVPKFTALKFLIQDGDLDTKVC